MIKDYKLDVIIYNKILVCYLFTKFDEEDDLKKFIDNYKSFSSGYNHKLIICLKLLNKDKINYLNNFLDSKNIKFELFNDINKNNDFDFGSYYRIAKKYKDYLIFYLNASSRPISNNWLKLLINNYSTNTIIGTTASYESHASNIKLKKFYKIISFIFKIIKNNIYFNPFPNPHLRTTGFLIKAEDYINFYKSKSCKNKFDSWKIESGKSSITNFFLDKNFNVLLVNSDGKSFNSTHWHDSNTYCFKETSKLLISDKHTRKFDNMSDNDKEKIIRVVWGN